MIPLRRRGANAAVIGASMGGMLAARVLADHYERVVVFERDALPVGPEPRKGVPQARHVHALLARGLEILEHWFPGLEEQLRAAGCPYGDPATTVRWFQAGGFKQPAVTGLHGVSMSRAFLDHAVRERLRAWPNVTVHDGVEATALTANASGAITGLVTRRRDVDEALAFDLVVDASGRGSRAPQWLAELGRPRVPETNVEMRLSYTTCRVEAIEGVLPAGGHGMAILPHPPERKRGAVLLLLEDGDWLVTQMGWLGERIATTPEGFVADAALLPTPWLHDTLRATRIKSPLVVHHMPSSVRRHYERLPRFPAGFLVFGDALCSLNPAYAQGMTVSALQSLALSQALASSDAASLPRAFFPRAAAVIDRAWLLATASDFAFPDVQGVRPRGFELQRWYMGKVHEAALVDASVAGAFFRVVNLVAPPHSLLSPRVLSRVLMTSVSRAR